MSYSDYSSAEPISRVNSAALINFRLDNLWRDAHRHARAGSYDKWNDDLDRVWLELVGDLDEEEEKDQAIFKKYEELTLDYAKANKVVKKIGFQSLSSEDKKARAMMKIALIKKEAFLRRLLHKQGKGTAYRDAAEDYMD